ncbi:MAG: tetratricopeptide repeat protein, partial [Planctomycetes bacterium]|nr:tetratricopeptide repeat protein [Planctomycetota bacterium]
ARVHVVVGDESKDTSGARLRIRTLRSGEGFLTQSSKWLHFGLGEATKIEKVIVHWPGGIAGDEKRRDIEEFTALSIDGRFELVQGSGISREMPPRRGAIKLVASQPQLPTPSARARISLAVRLPVAPFRYEDFAGEGHVLPPSSPTPVLINLWSRSCRPCLKELTELAQRAAEIRAAGIDVVALSVDALESDGLDSAASEQALSRIEFPFASGHATRAMVAELQRLYQYQSPLTRKLPLPTSFLIDGQGRLAVVYKGPLAVDDLLVDAGRAAGSRAEQLERSALLPGRAIRHKVIDETMARDQVQLYFQRANDLRAAGRLPEAIDQYKQVLALDGDFAKAHNNLALAYRRRGDLELAKAHYEHALRLDPDSPEVHNNFGVLLFQQRDLAGAKAHYDHALRENPQYVDAHMNLGVLLEREGKLREARSHYERALRIDPTLVWAEINLGRSFERQRDFTQAASHYQRALKINPNHVDAHNNLGVAYYNLGDASKARAHYENALRIDANSAEAHNNLGVLLEDDGQLLEAKAHYESALRINSGYQAARRNLIHVQQMLESK